MAETTETVIVECDHRNQHAWVTSTRRVCHGCYKTMGLIQLKLAEPLISTRALEAWLKEAVDEATAAFSQHGRVVTRSLASVQVPGAVIEYHEGPMHIARDLVERSLRMKVEALKAEHPVPQLQLQRPR